MNYLIIGNSAAGVSAAETIRGFEPDLSITIVSDEPSPFYTRCLTPELISGRKTAQDIELRPASFYQQLGIQTRFGERVDKVFPEQSRVALTSGEYLPYDKLLIATGARPVKLGDGRQKGGIFSLGRKRGKVFTLRTIDDALNIKKAAKGAKRSIVVGGGLLGLKVAQAFRSLGLEVTIVEKLDHLLPGITDSPAARILAGVFEEQGIKIETGVGVSEFRNGSVTLEDSRTLNSDVTVVAVGLKPNIELVEGTAVKTQEGILTDSMMMTNVENIYAAGDVVEDDDLLIPGAKLLNYIWPKAVLQGRIAGSNMVGTQRTYGGSFIMSSEEFYGLPLISAGLVSPPEKEYQEEVVKFSEPKRAYQKLVFEKDRLVGAVLLGDIEKAGVIINLIRAQRDVSAVRDELLSGTLGYGKILKVSGIDLKWLI